MEIVYDGTDSSRGGSCKVFRVKEYFGITLNRSPRSETGFFGKFEEFRVSKSWDGKDGRWLTETGDTSRINNDRARSDGIIQAGALFMAASTNRYALN